MQSEDASDVGYGAIGGAASAAFSPDLLKAIDPTGAALSPGQQAAMEGFATLLGGGLAGLAGANAQGGANAALNEVMNNTDDHPETAAKNGGAVTAFLGMLVNSQQQANSLMDGPSSIFRSYLDAVFHTGSPQQPQDPNGLGSSDGTNNTPSTGAAPVTTEVCIPGEGRIVTPSLVPTGSPNNTSSNVTLSSGNNGDDTGSTATGQGPSGSTGNSSFWSSTGSSTAVENAYGHWDKHLSEFPEYQNAVQYVQGAQDFVSNPPAGTLTKTRPNGDTLLYNPSTNTFAVKTIDGAPRTMFRHQGGMTYWNKQ